MELNLEIILSFKIEKKKKKNKHKLIRHTCISAGIVTLEANLNDTLF